MRQLLATLAIVTLLAAWAESKAAIKFRYWAPSGAHYAIGYEDRHETVG